MKKVLSLILSFALIFALSSTAFAAPNDINSITSGAIGEGYVTTTTTLFLGNGESATVNAGSHFYVYSVSSSTLYVYMSSGNLSTSTGSILAKYTSYYLYGSTQMVVSGS